MIGKRFAYSSKKEVFSLVTVLSVFAFVFCSQYAQGSAGYLWTTDAGGNPQTDFSPEQIVYINGAGLIPNSPLSFTLMRPDGSIEYCSLITCDARFTQGPISSDGNGGFSMYEYDLDGILGTYTIWVSDGTNTCLGTFTDANIDFSQCANDQDNNQIKDSCNWINGAINQNNAIYTEGDSVPQRLLLKIDNKGTHTVRIRYEFTKSDEYAYDFLTTPNLTQTGSLLNPCADRPGFVNSSMCNTLFSNARLVAIPSDGFDQVSSRENPANRYIFIGGVSSPSVSIVGHNPSTNCFQNCGDSTVNLDITFTTAANNTIVAIWFGGHLAQAADPDGAGPLLGWGAGFGSRR